MRSSLGLFIICIVAGFLTGPAFGQTRNLNSVQSADYWQSSSNQKNGVQTKVQPNQQVGYNAPPCNCETQPGVPMQSVPMQSTMQSAPVYSNGVNYANGYAGGYGVNSGCDTCPTPYGGACETGGCYTNSGAAYGAPYGACNTCPMDAAYGNYGLVNACGIPSQAGQWFLKGWIQQGVTINPQGPSSRFNGVMGFTDRSNDYQLNQAYLSFGRNVNSESCQWDIGGRVDALYGTDYFFTSALGLETETYLRGNPKIETLNPSDAELKWNDNDGPRANGSAAMYGFSLPQFYGEIQGPWGTNVKGGHFYSPMGHESAMATQNFFYTHSYTMMYGEPGTLTGMMLSQRFTPYLTGYFGVHRGWNKWDTPIDEISYIAGAKLENIYRTTSLGFLVNTGKDAWDNTEVPRGKAQRTNYSLVFSHQLSPNLHYVLQHDLGIDENAGWTPTSGAFDGKWYSVAQYIYLQMTPTLAFGCRAEWFKDKNHTKVLGINAPKGTRPGIGGDDFIDLSLGFNWKPTPYINFRPEVRWDWAKDCKIFNDGEDTNRFLIGMDLTILIN